MDAGTAESTAISIQVVKSFMDHPDSRQGGLRPVFSPLGMWAFSIGTSIGWGSFIVTCNTYLQKSGVLGTVFGMLLGMAVILVITWNLQYMIRKSPAAGGIYAFEKQAGEKDLGFLAFWFILLTYLAILWANMTSLPLFARFFLGDAFRFGFHYSIFGYEVWLGEALLSICAMGLIALLCVSSSRLPNRIVTVAALLFAAGFTVCAVIAVAGHDQSFSYSPLYMEGSSVFGQIVRIAAISPWAFIGFENISHFSEEYSFPVKKVRGVLIGSVVITTVLYLFVSLLSVSAYPSEYDSWAAYIRDMGNLEGIKAVPAFYAADHYLGQTGVAVLMVALFSVILTSLIGNLLALSRLLYAAGREGEAPAALGKLNRRGIPAAAIGAVACVCIFIPFLGRTAIGWIVDVTTLGATIIYFLISHGVYLQARKDGRRTESVTGLAGMALMSLFVLLLLIPGLLPFHAMETESYILFIVWSVLGLIMFRRLIRQDRYRGYGQRAIVWVLLLVLVLFASVMWVSRATENAANEAVERIHVYHDTHPSDDSDETVNAERVAFLQGEADRISSTNILYTVVSLGLFLLSITILLNNYRDTRRMGQQLSAAEKEAENARRIAELKQSITSLLDNMPAISFSKNAETGVYLACNQAFAEYAHKASPEEVLGLTDADLFDPETAGHFMNTDRIAQSKDRPYIYTENVMDAGGNQRYLQTTKLKFIDASGRLCVLGMCQDITSSERIRRAEERAEEERIACARVNALSGDYLSVHIVDPETGRYREYNANAEYDRFELPNEGSDFFSYTLELAPDYVYPEDLQRFLQAFSRENIMAEIREKGLFILTYRLLVDGKPTYVQLKAAMVEEKEGPRLIFGINNIDMQIRQENEYRRRIEQAQIRAGVDTLTGVKSKYAYQEMEERLDQLITEHRAPAFAIIVLDVNDLKKVNDTAGHQAGDQYLRDACSIICRIFKHSPVFRIGGDEFAVVSQGEDLNQIENLVADLTARNEQARRNGGIVIACGMARYEDDERVADIFARADRLMYENKRFLKEDPR